MANRSKSKPPAANAVSAAGIVEAIEQDVELSMQQVKAAAHEAVVAVEKKFGVGLPRAPKQAQKQKTPKVVAKTTTSRTLKTSSLKRKKPKR